MRLGFAGVVAAVVFGISGWFLGPRIVVLLYGAAFAPLPRVAGLAAAAVGLALASLFLNQIYVARGETGRLAVIWWTALGIAALILILVSAQPVDRVAIAFLVGEAVALLLLVTASIATHYRQVAVDA